MGSLPHSIQGIIWALLYCLAGAFADVSARTVLDSGLPLTQTVFLRCALPIFIFLPFILRSRKESGILPKNMKCYALMGFLLLGSIVSFYKALTCLPLPQLAALSFISTLLTVFFAVIFFKEPLKFFRVAGLLVGLLGALIIIRPGFIAFDPGIIYSLISSLCWACFLLLNKRVSTEDTAYRVAFYPLLFMTPVALPFAVMEWQWPNLYQWIGVLSNALFIGFVFVAKTRAFALADLSTVMPIDFSYLVFMSIAGYFIFGELLDFLTLIGAIIIIVSAWYIVLGESKKHVAKEAEILH